MNVQTRTPSSASRRPPLAASEPAAARPAYHQHRAREFGVGYGRSSGYASGRRYADNWGNALFRCG